MRTLSYFCCFALLDILSACRTVTFPELSPAPTFGQTGPEPASEFLYIVDSSYFHISDAALKAIVSEQQATSPKAWGRYLLNRAGGGGAKDFTFAELAAAANARVALVPLIMPAQGDLKGNYAEGASLAVEAMGLVAALTKSERFIAPSGQVLVFLDIEGDSNPVSDDFLTGWCVSLRNYDRAGLPRMLPAIYTNAGAAAVDVRRALIRTESTCAIEGLWLANYARSAGLRPTAWQDMYIDTKKILPAIPPQIPIYLWQYSERGVQAKIDYSMVNPALSKQFFDNVLQPN